MVLIGIIFKALCACIFVIGIAAIMVCLFLAMRIIVPSVLLCIAYYHESTGHKRKGK